MCALVLCVSVHPIRRLLHFAAAYDTPLTSDPPLITLITLSCLGGAGGLSSPLPLELLSLVAQPHSIIKSFKWPCFSSSVTSSCKAWHSSVRCRGLCEIRTIFCCLSCLGWISFSVAILLLPPFLSRPPRVLLARCLGYIRVI